MGSSNRQNGELGRRPHWNAPRKTQNNPEQSRPFSSTQHPSLSRVNVVGDIQPIETPLIVVHASLSLSPRPSSPCPLLFVSPASHPATLLHPGLIHTNHSYDNFHPFHSTSNMMNSIADWTAMEAAPALRVIGELSLNAIDSVSPCDPFMVHADDSDPLTNTHRRLSRSSCVTTTAIPTRRLPSPFVFPSTKRKESIIPLAQRSVCPAELSYQRTSLLPGLRTR